MLNQQHSVVINMHVASKQRFSSTAAVEPHANHIANLEQIQQW